MESNSKGQLHSVGIVQKDGMTGIKIDDMSLRGVQGYKIEKTKGFTLLSINLLIGGLKLLPNNVKKEVKNMEEKHAKLKKEIIEIFIRNNATIDELDYIAVWLMQEKERGKKHLLREIPVQEVLKTFNR